MSQPSDFPKRCRACGRVYTQAQWTQLKYLGVTHDDPDELPLEWRNCLCGSTLVVHVEPRPLGSIFARR